MNLYLDKSHSLIDPFDETKALETYQNRFVPLHYHELWASVVSELEKIENINEERSTRITVQQVQYTKTCDKTERTAMLIGTYSSTLSESFSMIDQFITQL